MGQYHLLVNLDKREFVDPHKLGNGFKLYEQIGSEYGIPQAMHVLLCACPESRGGGDYCADANEAAVGILGRWVGDRVVIVGDYAEKTDHPRLGVDLSAAYRACRENEDDAGSVTPPSYTDISGEVRTVLGKLLGIVYDAKDAGGWVSVSKDPAARYSIIEERAAGG